MWKAAIIFLAVYAWLVLSKRYRPLIAWLGIAAALVLGSLRPLEVVTGVNWNVIGIFFGSLILAELLIDSRVPETISDHLINHSRNLGLAFLFIIAFASVLSIFIENVVTVLIVAPIALQLTRKAGVSPVPVIVGLAISSNLQGVAILIGDSPSMILAARMRMSFGDFFWYSRLGLPGIFWLVEVGAVAGFVVLHYFLKGNRQRPERIPVTAVKSWIPVWLITVTIVLLSVASYFDRDLKWFGGSACMLVGVAGYLWHRVRGGGGMWGFAKRLDWGTTAFLVAVFVLVFMLEQRGAIAALVGRLEGLKGANTFLVYTAVVWVSVLISAFIDNVPYITAMLPVVIGLSRTLGMPGELLVFGVLIGSCLGGNITPIGASANLVAFRILEREGKPISFGSFVKVGLPFTVAATTAAYLLLWFLYH